MTSKQIKIIVLVGSYLPGYKGGGPIRSIANLVEALGKEFDFNIVTLDRDLGESLPFPGVVTNRWVQVGRANVIYLRSGLRSFLSMYELLRSIDENTILYLNSFFSRCFSMLPVLMCWLKLCRPKSLIIAPRGEFSLGAIQFKRTRKRLYLWISQRLGLYSSVIWQASSMFEIQDINRQFLSVTEVAIASVITSYKRNERSKVCLTITAADIAVEPNTISSRIEQTKIPGRLKIVFVSRLSRKKNLSGALRMLERLSGYVSFDIYGPKEDQNYWNECQRLIGVLPQNIQVRYMGAIENEIISSVLAEYNLFLFPTLGENFGHVIYEALAAGCPVLISDQTPWRNLEEEGVGWDIPLDAPGRFISVLQLCVNEDHERFSARSKRAIEYAANNSLVREAIKQNRFMFTACGAMGYFPHGQQ